MVDSENLRSEQSEGEAPWSDYLAETVAHTSAPFKLCRCDICEDRIYGHAVKPAFSGYSKFNPFAVEQLTEHQYFLCGMAVEAFVFKFRIWGEP